MINCCMLDPLLGLGLEDETDIKGHQWRNGEWMVNNNNNNRFSECDNFIMTVEENTHTLRWIHADVYRSQMSDSARNFQVVQPKETKKCVCTQREKANVENLTVGRSRFLTYL